MKAYAFFMLVLRQHMQHIEGQVPSLVEIKNLWVHGPDHCVGRLHVGENIDGISYDIPNLFFDEKALRFPFDGE